MSHLQTTLLLFAIFILTCLISWIVIQRNSIPKRKVKNLDPEKDKDRKKVETTSVVIKSRWYDLRDWIPIWTLVKALGVIILVLLCLGLIFWVGQQIRVYSNNRTLGFQPVALVTTSQPNVVPWTAPTDGYGNTIDIPAGMDFIEDPDQAGVLLSVLVNEGTEEERVVLLGPGHRDLGQAVRSVRYHSREGRDLSGTVVLRPHRGLVAATRRL
ncbi:MAG TPA: hypothetical protein VFA52_00895 [Candidatus Paceibacterota bacterium]|nr:hypothetical protein [Candidatus Paceibacterota bacterium]